VRRGLVALMACAGLLAGACGRAPAAAETERVATGTSDDGSTTEVTERLIDGAWTRDGVSRRVDPDGVVVEEGAYVAGLPSGVWITRHPDGALASQGSYLMGEQEGVWIYRAPDGTLDEERTGVYESGERVAPWYEEGTRSGRLKSGMTQQATYAHGLRNGPARGFFPDGARESEGSYEDGLRTGRWTYWLPSGEVDRAKSGVYRLDVKLAETEEATGR